MKEPEPTPKRTLLGHLDPPEGYWQMSEEEQRAWASEAVRHLRERLGGASGRPQEGAPGSADGPEQPQD